MEYITKSPEQQARDKSDLSLWARIDKEEYFHQLQLTNKLVGVDTYEKVGIADRKLSAARGAELSSVQYEGELNVQFFKDIHEYLFQDIYYFAGQYRTMDMELDSVTRFASARSIESNMNKLFDNLAQDNYLKGLDKTTFCNKTAKYLTELNRIHPFREGNGRGKRAFFSQLAEQAGYRLDWSAVKAEDWKLADASAFDNARDGQYNDDYLRALLDAAVSPMAGSVKADKVITKEEFLNKRQPQSGLMQMISNMPKANSNVAAANVMKATHQNIME